MTLIFLCTGGKAFLFYFERRQKELVFKKKKKLYVFSPNASFCFEKTFVRSSIISIFVVMRYRNVTGG